MRSSAYSRHIGCIMKSPEKMGVKKRRLKMPQIPMQWEEIHEFVTMAEKLISHYPERYGKVDPKWIIAYGCTNKDLPEGKTKPYEMSGASEPESFTNSKKYFIKFYMSDWESKTEEAKYWLVCSALERLDREIPDNGKVGPYDLKDQATLVRTLGVDWQYKSKLPHPLRDAVEFIEQPVSD